MKPTKRDIEIVNKRYRDLYRIETDLFYLLQDEGDLEKLKIAVLYGADAVYMVRVIWDYNIH